MLNFITVDLAGDKVPATMTSESYHCKRPFDPIYTLQGLPET